MVYLAPNRYYYFSLLPIWSPPLGSVKVNIDASWRRLDARGHVGVVICDSSSACLAVRRRDIQGQNVMVAEALGILEECVLARRRGFARVVVESDSMDLISCLNGCIECWLGGVPTLYDPIGRSILPSL